MEITNHAFWALVHGMGFGAAFLLAFAGGLAGLYSLRPELVTAEGISERTSRLRIGMIIMAVLVWGSVLALGATLFGYDQATGDIHYSVSFVRGAIVEGCVLTFLGLWAWLIARRP